MKLYELQLSRQLSIESLLNDLGVTFKYIRTIDDERWLFRKATLASTELEALGYSPDESILQKFWKICERQLNIPGGLFSPIQCFLFISGSSSSHLIVI
ncbi:hypothetical protein KY285_030273 [Solanum tuberosum]|nr:hypothetical protein KY285_030273 [Solanum tuberosum]